MTRPTIALDLDGVLADFRAGWQGVDVIGDPIPGAREFAGALYEFADILIYTARCGEDLNGDEIEKRAAVIRAWLAKHRIPYTDIWTGRGKPTARAYVDDCAVECEPDPSLPEAIPQKYIEAYIETYSLCFPFDDEGEDSGDDEGKSFREFREKLEAAVKEAKGKSDTGGEF